MCLHKLVLSHLSIGSTLCGITDGCLAVESYINVYMPLFCSCMQEQPCRICVIILSDHGITLTTLIFSLWPIKSNIIARLSKSNIIVPIL